MEIPCLLFSRTRRPAAASGPFPLCFLLGVFPDLDHTLVVAIHAIDALTCLCKDKLVNTLCADFALEAMGMI